MDILAIFGIAIVATILSVILKQYKPEYALFVTLIAGIIIFFIAIKTVDEIIVYINQLLYLVDIDSRFIKVLFKALGICIATSLAYDCCNDAGQTSLANKVEMIGKLAIVMLSLPLFEEVLGVISSLIR